MDTTCQSISIRGGGATGAPTQTPRQALSPSSPGGPGSYRRISRVLCRSRVLRAIAPYNASSNPAPTQDRFTCGSNIHRCCTFLRCSRQAQAREGVGFAVDATGKTWCARRTLPHAQSILLISDRSHAPAWERIPGRSGVDGNRQRPRPFYHRGHDPLPQRANQPSRAGHARDVG